MSGQPLPVTADVMIDGCLAAIDRLLAVTQDHAMGADDTFVPLFEALNWAASIDLWYEEQGRPVGNEPLRAIRFARNRVHHQWALALERHDWPGTPIVAAGRSQRIGPPPGFYWTWKQLADLLPGHADSTGEPLYTKHLAGRHAEPTLQALKPVLEALR